MSESFDEIRVAQDKPIAQRALPKGLIDRLLRPVHRFLHVEASSGIVLLFCTVSALILANSQLADAYHALWELPVSVSIGSFKLAYPFRTLVINDALMTIFFFVVGLEIKREIVSGELSDPRKAALPVLAAIGGMIVPALVYSVFQIGQPGLRGWAIPMATDIAFVVGFLALLGKGVPFGLKIFLLSLAIADDLGAVLIIALVFSDKLEGLWVWGATAGFFITYLLNVIGVRRVGVYILVGAAIWLCFLKSGIHPTVAGVLLGLLTPVRAWVPDSTFSVWIEEFWNRTNKAGLTPERRVEELARLQFIARESVSPLQRLENALHPWVAFGIMPLFALANAGVKLDPDRISDSVAVAVAAGLVIGKPLGILLFCRIALKLKVAALPDGVNMPMLVGGSCLAGIGFTMSLFINGLAFPGSEFARFNEAGKIGTLMGSACSAAIGASILIVTLLKSRVSRTQHVEP
ncbi:Na+/H+ antiporter NhaA [bacterium]|nr:Na+/H+ antiporter NhaA [bacterium]